MKSMIGQMKNLVLAVVLGLIVLPVGPGTVTAQEAAEQAAEEAPGQSSSLPPVRPSEMPLLPPRPQPQPLRPAPEWHDLDDDALLPGQRLTRVRIAVLNATGKERGAYRVALMLDAARRRPLENRMGLMIDLVNISSSEGYSRADTVVFYKPGFLRPALILAQAIPGQTLVEAMRPESMTRTGVDVEVLINRALP